MPFFDTPHAWLGAFSLPLLFGASCSVAGYEDLAGPTVATTISDSTVGEQPPAQTSTADSGIDSGVQAPAFWSVTGELDVSKSLVQLDTSSVSVGLWSEDAELLCTVDLPLFDVGGPGLPKTEAALFQWAAIDHDMGIPDKYSDCPPWPAGTLELGIGPYDSALDPAMDAAGMLGADVYGFYVRPSDDDPVYLVGIARTQGLMEGTETTVIKGPLPDGTYAVDTLVLLTAPPLP